MSRFTTVRIPRWGGHNGDERPQALADGDLVSEKNVYLRGETLGTRPGLEHDDQYTSSFDPGTDDALQGMIELRDAFDATRNLMVIGDGKPQVIGQSGGSDTPTSVKGGLTITAGQNNRWTLATMKGAVYGAGGAASDTALFKWTIQDDSTATGSLNAATAVTVPLISGNAVGPLNVFQWENRLYLNGFSGTDAAGNPMVGRYSNLNDGDTWDRANTIGGQGIGGFSSYGDEYATGWGIYEDNEVNVLLFLSNKRVYSVARTGDGIAPFAKTDDIQAGCVSQHAFASLGLDHGDAVWVSEKGIHSIRQSQSHGDKANTFLSWKIRDIWDTLNRSRLKYATASYWPEVGVVLFSLSTGSSTTNNLILCLDVKSNQGMELTAEGARWYQWELAGVNANVMRAARDASGNPYLYVGTVEGDVCRFQTSTFDDLGTAYAAHFTTKHNDLGFPGAVKFPGDVFVKLQPGGAYRPTMRAVYDYGEKRSSALNLEMPTDPTVWGQFVWGQSVWATPNVTFRQKARPFGSGETIAFQFSHGGSNEPFYVADLAYQVAARGEDMGQEAA